MQPKQHNYPKTRKPRDTSYSTTYKILAAIGKDRLFEIWKNNGHIKTSFIVSDMLDGLYVTPMIIQYIAQRKFGWQRIVTDKNLSIYKAVLSGSVDPSRYKTIIFA
jgi:hypothetical protein